MLQDVILALGFQPRQGGGEKGVRSSFSRFRENKLAVEGTEKPCTTTQVTLHVLSTTVTLSLPCR